MLIALNITSFISFYPFCAFFTLYYHILSSTDLAECESDICSLEALVEIMADIASVRPDFAPIANALGALNDVSRAVHSGRAPAQGLTVVFQGPQPPASQDPGSSDTREQDDAQVSPQPNLDLQPLPPFESMQSLSADVSLQAQPPFNDTFGIPFELQHQVALDSNGPDPARPGTAQSLAEPVEFVRAIESELIWRNWHESWWSDVSI